MINNPNQQTLLDNVTDKSYENSTDQWKKNVAGQLKQYGMRNKSKRYDRCEKENIVFTCENDHNHKKFKPFRCEVRICPECSSRQAWNLYFELKDYIKDKLVEVPGFRFRHIVLTVPVSNLVQDTMKAFKRIEYIRQYFYKKFRIHKHKWGAVIGFELGRKNLMAHFHLLVYAPYINQYELRKIWKWGHVYIKLVNDRNSRNKALFNVCLYIVQFFEKYSGVLPDPNTVAFIEYVLSGKRRIKTWGIFYNRLAKKYKAPMICEKCGGTMGPYEFQDQNGVIFPFEYWYMRDMKIQYDP